jgi:hypothetical protein
MIVRVVKLVIDPDKLDLFFSEFEKNKFKISSFKGCQGMKLLQDINQSNTIMTYSHWDSEEALQAYSDSNLFASVWDTVKPHFIERPQAWSHQIYFDGFIQ